MITGTRYALSAGVTFNIYRMKNVSMAYEKSDLIDLLPINQVHLHRKNKNLSLRPEILNLQTPSHCKNFLTNSVLAGKKKICKL